MEQVRRSCRARTTNNTYVNDPFAGLEDVLYASSDSGSTESSPPLSEAGEEEFQAAVDPDAPVEDEEENDEDDEEEDEALLDSETDEPKRNAARTNTDDAIYDFELDEAAPKELRNATRKATSRRVVLAASRRALLATSAHVNRMPQSQFLKEQWSQDADVRSRAISEYHTRGAKELRLISTFGPSKEDIEPILKVREKLQWDPTLPTRHANKHGVGGMAPTFYLSENERKREIEQTKKWYSKQGAQGIFETKQQTDWLSIQDGVKYMPEPDYHNLLMGPYGHQRLYTLKTGEGMALAESFIDDGDHINNTGSIKPQRPGWILYLGSRIQQLQWLPNEIGAKQYLAVSVLQKNTKGRTSRPFHNPKSPAFSAQRPFPTSIQIWAFRSLNNGTVDTKQPPTLDLVICTDWGSVKQFKWCPVPMSDSISLESTKTIHLGLLAGVWDDGKIRVLDVSYPESPTNSTQYLHIKEAAFEAQPPNTVCACVTWLSGTSIAAGTANGSVAIWNLTTVLPNPAPNPNPRPWFYHTLNGGYILNIVSAYPSHPHFLATNCVDGYVRLTDLRAPHLDTVLSSRSRIFAVALAWLEHLQCFILPDEHYYVRALPIRRFYMHLSFMRANSQAVALACSPVHGSVLAGCVDGAVWAGSPVRKMFDAKMEAWQQVWFGHEWRRGKRERYGADESTRDNEEANDGETIDPQSTATTSETADVSAHQAPTSESTGLLVKQAPDPSILRKPLSRIMDGYKPLVSDLSQRMNGPNVEEIDARYTTIYEEETAITQLAWNPNLRFGGWAAAGVGCGLLRIEDIAVDGEAGRKGFRKGEDD